MLVRDGVRRFAQNNAEVTTRTMDHHSNIETKLQNKMANPIPKEGSSLILTLNKALLFMLMHEQRRL